MNIFDQMLSRFEIRTNDDYLNAQHEVMQQIALAGLFRGGFFTKAAFYGGTCMRIFYASGRYSEDMDFSLLVTDSGFRFEVYFDPIISEFKALGRNVIITRKEKKQNSHMESAFLKEDTSVYDLRFTTEKSIKIKIEVDTDPPSGFSTEHKLLLLPFSFMVRCYCLPDLFAGKIHALLFRSWKNRIKGRDWYDFEWHIRNDTKINLGHLNRRIGQSGIKNSEELTLDQIRHMLKDKIQKTNIDLVKNDVRPFIKNPDVMEIWSTEYFMQLAERLHS